MAQVKLTSITKTFGDVTALQSIDLEIKDKEFFVLLGPTGAGKTTMLRLVAGLEKPDTGDVLLDGESVKRHACLQACNSKVAQQERSKKGGVQHQHIGNDPDGYLGIKPWMGN